MKKLYEIKFTGFQFNDEDYDLNGYMIVKAENKDEAEHNFTRFFQERATALSVLIERNFTEDGLIQKHVEISELPNDDNIVTWDLGGYYGD